MAPTPVHPPITITMMKTTIMDDEPDRQADAFAPLDMSNSEASNRDALASSEAATRLLVWLSPAFPVGSFAFSHGLEWAVHDGHISDVSSTIAWLETLIEHGALRNDAIIAACAWRTAHAGDATALREINQLALAMTGSRERYLETTAQGNAFIAVTRDAWCAPAWEHSLSNLDGDIAYPVAVAVTSAAHEIALSDMLRFYTLALVQNLISATIRLSVIGHTDGQRAIAALLPVADRSAAFAASGSLDDLGGAAFQSDIASMRHETQYSRLFRS
jgi:urease accessory protein